MTAQKILKMIETVDPNDTAKLDEIDARFWCWLNGYKPHIHGKADSYNFGYEFTPTRGIMFASVYETGRFTRSRDALKQIRPDGWTFEMSQVNDGGDWGCELTNLSDNKIVGYFHGTCESFKTEELAELYTTIQAIEYERTKK